MAAQESLFTHDVSLTATVGAVPLFFSVKVVVRTAVTGFVVVHIDPSTPLTVPTLLLLWLFGHVVWLIGVGWVKMDRYLDMLWLVYNDEEMQCM